MDNNLVDAAINYALKCNWEKAITANKKILSETPDDTDALNRLARAYYESGNITAAKRASKQVLQIEPANKIAEKALEKYNGQKNKKLSTNDQNITVSDFIEVPGLTKQANLLNLCSETTIATLDSGDEATLVTHSHRVSVTTIDGKYIGKLPDDISAKLRVLTKRGYKYKVIIKSADKQCIKIFIKEMTRGKGYENAQSFPRESLESISEFSS